MTKLCCSLTILLCLLISVPAFAGPINVLAHYRLGDADPGATSGNTVNATTVDSSGNGNTLTRFGSPTYVPGSPYDPTGLGVSFSGLGDYFAGPEITVGTDNFGIEAWVNASSTSPGNRSIAYNGRTDISGFGLFQINNQFAFLYGGVTVPTVATVTQGQWVHLALVRDTGMTSFFVDGTLVFSSFDGPNPLDGTGGMMIGANHVGTENFEGSISEVRLFTFDPGTFRESDLLNVPEPTTVTLLGLGLTGLVLSRRKKA